MTWLGGILAGIGALYLLGWLLVGGYWLVRHLVAPQCPSCGSRWQTAYTTRYGKKGCECESCGYGWEK